MASRSTIIEPGELTEFGGVANLISDLQNVLDRLDHLGMSHAGAVLASVIDLLVDPISDAGGSAQASQS